MPEVKWFCVLSGWLVKWFHFNFLSLNQGRRREKVQVRKINFIQVTPTFLSFKEFFHL